jgi:hypothetical protein
MILGYACLREIVEKLIPRKSTVPVHQDSSIFQKAQKIAWVVSIAAQHGFYKGTCLRRSLVTWIFLRREQIDSDIFFGVRITDHQLEAHAWVEYQGMVVNDTTEIGSVFRPLVDTLSPTNWGL